MYNSKNLYINPSSTFANSYIGFYKVRSITDKGIYYRTMILSNGKCPELLKDIINWSHLRCYISKDDNEFFIKENIKA